MRDAGLVVPVSRGLYRLASLDPLTHPDLVTVAKRVRQGVLCLISALSFQELTTQVPHTIDVALERGKTKPRLDYPPIRFFWFAGPAFHEGIETHELDGVPVRILYRRRLANLPSRVRVAGGVRSAMSARRISRQRLDGGSSIPTASTGSLTMSGARSLDVIGEGRVDVVLRDAAGRRVRIDGLDPRHGLTSVLVGKSVWFFGLEATGATRGFDGGRFHPRAFHELPRDRMERRAWALHVFGEEETGGGA
jgi:hypothetical protein